MIQTQNTDFCRGAHIGQLYYQSDFEENIISDREITELLAEAFSPTKRMLDALSAKDMPSTDEYYAGFITGCLQSIFLEMRQIRIICSYEHMEGLVDELKQQFQQNSVVVLSDWGWSSKYQCSYIELNWKGPIDPAFEAHIRDDHRILRFTVLCFSELLTNLAANGTECGQLSCI